MLRLPCRSQRLYACAGQRPADWRQQSYAADAVLKPGMHEYCTPSCALNEPSRMSACVHACADTIRPLSASAQMVLRILSDQDDSPRVLRGAGVLAGVLRR